MRRDPDLIIAGLGNPGAAYDQTRHNLGFRVVDLLARWWKAPSFHDHGFALMTHAKLSEKEVLLVKPLTYMNRSGIALEKIVCFSGFQTEQLVVAHDDIDLPVGRLRLRKNGGSGGHKGIQSIIERLEDNNFIRVRIGIGKPDTSGETTDYVLTRFTGPEIKIMDAVIERAAHSIEMIMSEGLISAMNTFNKEIVI